MTIYNGSSTSTSSSTCRGTSRRRHHRRNLHPGVGECSTPRASGSSISRRTRPARSRSPARPVSPSWGPDHRRRPDADCRARRMRTAAHPSGRTGPRSRKPRRSTSRPTRSAPSPSPSPSAPTAESTSTTSPTPPTTSSTFKGGTPTRNSQRFRVKGMHLVRGRLPSPLLLFLVRSPWRPPLHPRTSSSLTLTATTRLRTTGQTVPCQLLCRLPMNPVLM